MLLCVRRLKVSFSVPSEGQSFGFGLIDLKLAAMAPSTISTVDGEKCPLPLAAARSCVGLVCLALDQSEPIKRQRGWLITHRGWNCLYKKMKEHFS